MLFLDHMLSVIAYGAEVAAMLTAKADGAAHVAP
jgi:hypothetical protein